MSWPRDALLRERHPFLVAMTSYVEGTTHFFLVATSLMRKQTVRDHSNPGLSEMDNFFLLTLNI